MIYFWQKLTTNDTRGLQWHRKSLCGQKFVPIQPVVKNKNKYKRKKEKRKKMTQLSNLILF